MNKFKAAAQATVNAAKDKGNSECVKVVVRCRPLSQKEVDEGRQRMVEMDLSAGQISLRNPKAGPGEPPKVFSFDLVYDWNCKQIEVYEESALPIVESTLEGYNGTIFAYGQTGTGKTWTDAADAIIQMEGLPDSQEVRGITPNAFQTIFAHIEKSKTQQYLVRASFLEIYNEDVRDLLAKNSQNRLEVKENPDSGVYVKDLTGFVVNSVAELNNVLAVGKKNRSVGATLMNQDSSRSHSIFTVTIECSSGAGEDAHIRVGKLNLVDLAGSERQSKTGATGDRLKEATKINLSLSALGNVISALVDGRSGHIPYRDSKLTRLLQDSLGGNTKTVMIANMGPADYNFDESLSTLRYANRAKNIQNKPKINEDPKDTMLREYQEEIAKLKAAIASGGGDPSGAPSSFHEVVEEVVDEKKRKAIMQKVRRDMEQQVREELRKEMVNKAKEEVDLQVEKKLKKLQEKKLAEEKEKAALAEQTQGATAEVQRLRDAQQAERQKQQELQQKLLSMQSKVLVGDDNVLEQLAEQDEEEARLERERRQAAKAEAATRRRLEELEEVDEMNNAKFDSVNQEVEAKSKKLKKLWTKYQSAKSEIEDVQEEFAKEREYMIEDIRRLTREIKLKNLIIDSYVPPDELEKISRRAVFDEADESWSIDRMQYAGNPQRARQASEVLKMAKEKGRAVPTGFEFSEADLEYVGYDINGVPMDGRMQAAIKQAFEQDGGKVFDVNEQLSNVYFTYTDGQEEDGGGGSGYGGEEAVANSGRPGSARSKAARPKSGRPGSAASKRRSSAGEEKLIGSLSDHVATLDDDSHAKNFPSAKGLKSNSRRG